MDWPQKASRRSLTLITMEKSKSEPKVVQTQPKILLPTPKELSAPVLPLGMEAAHSTGAMEGALGMPWSRDTPPGTQKGHPWSFLDSPGAAPSHQNRLCRAAVWGAELLPWPE